MGSARATGLCTRRRRRLYARGSTPPPDAAPVRSAAEQCAMWNAIATRDVSHLEFDVHSTPDSSYLCCSTSCNSPLIASCQLPLHSIPVDRFTLLAFSCLHSLRLLSLYVLNTIRFS